MGTKATLATILVIAGCSGSEGDSGNIVGSQCHAEVVPAQNNCVVSEEFGFFVNAAAAASADEGSKSNPFKELRRAMLEASAHPTRKNVFVCAGTYLSDTVDIRDGVAVYGYFSCDKGWSVDLAKRAVILAPAGGPGLRAQSIVSATRLDGLTVEVPSATKASASSVGLLAIDSPALSIVNTTFKVGDGADGEAGVAGKPPTPDPAQTVNGTDGYATSGSAKVCRKVPVVNPVSGQVINDGTALYNACKGSADGAPGGTNSCGGGGALAAGPGGKGGDGGVYAGYDIGGNFVTERPATSGTPNPGTSATASPGSEGARGADGLAGPSGAKGKFQEKAPYFLPGDGTPGEDGKPGQGGGGGAGVTGICGSAVTDQAYAGLNGAGGGAGGCAGLGGTAGKGGGASMGIVLIASPIRLDQVSIVTGKGGRGGRGSGGSKGSVGGEGGKNPFGKPGSKGGAGGDGGVGGAGAGGSSVGIVYSRGAPVRDALTKFLLGPAGEGVSEEAVGNAKIPPSESGAQLDVFEIKTN